MICSKCGGDVTWRRPFSNLTHTECSSCGARNAQVVHPEPDPDDWGCDHCRNDGALNEMNCCPECDAEFHCDDGDRPYEATDAEAEAANRTRL